MSEPQAVKSDAFVRAALAVAATYGYFLLFAEFSFLKLVRAAVGEGAGLQRVMAALGAGGVAGSVLAWRLFRRERFGRSLAWSYVACAVVAILALWAEGPVALPIVAASVGLALGWNTVTLASGLGALLHPDRLGWGIGLGTGTAYAFCNVPLVFAAAPAMQAAISAAVALFAAWAVFRIPTKWPADRAPVRSGVWRWVAAFLALVWLDSAAFYIIQRNDALRAATWDGSPRLWGNAAMHLGAALAAGWLLDRGRVRGVAGGAWLALAAACFSLGAGRPSGAVGWLYAGGVSLYSTALVFFAARSGRPGVAAAVFALAGWAGSALGIGMAQDLRGVPDWFVVASGVALGFALQPWRRTGLLALVAVALVWPGRAEEPAALVARGRDVYIAEGCMHCHSQYVRPGVKDDVERWGPAHPLEDLRRDGLPLPGNRRQGPDLANVGNRRSSEWNRLHLASPRAVSPGSRMPSYRHLFAPGDGRGEALLAYLDSLGEGTAGAHWATAMEWSPSGEGGAIPREDAQRLFAQDCMPCHGPAGRADGPLAGKLRLPPPDWSREAWRRAPEGDETALARVIKFGAPGTTMAGHEAFSDPEILGLARYVKTLHK